MVECEGRSNGDQGDGSFAGVRARADGNDRRFAGVHTMLRKSAVMTQQARNKTKFRQMSMKNLMLLDSDSNAAIFCDKKHVTNAWRQKRNFGNIFKRWRC